jgi:hypothetical protein
MKKSLENSMLPQRGKERISGGATRDAYELRQDIDRYEVDALYYISRSEHCQR